MRKLIYNLIVLALSIISFGSCTSEDRDQIDLSGDTGIRSFVINGVEGAINTDNSTISVILPSGTDLKGLTPAIEIADGAVISPASGVSMDFADANDNLISVVYLVTSKDSYQKYTVNVDVARAKITSFKIGAVEADIDEIAKEINIWLPEGTDVTSLIPVVEYTEGAEMSPSSGSSIDFTNPVAFSLNYLGSIFTYTVNVNLGEKPLDNLIIYDGETVKPTWAALASTLNNGYINPLTDGINPTSTCISIMRKKVATDDGGRPWSGGALWNQYKVNVDPAIYDRFELMILKTSAGTVQLEIQGDGETNKDWLKVAYTAEDAGKWQKLTFMIPASRTAVINNVLVAPHVDDTAADPNFTDQMMYWDQLIAIPKQQ